MAQVGHQDIRRKRLELGTRAKFKFPPLLPHQNYQPPEITIKNILLMVCLVT